MSDAVSVSAPRHGKTHHGEIQSSQNLDAPSPVRRKKTRKPETSEYMTWKQMRMRCNNKNDKRYARYGGRGITVCDRWNDFRLFLKDMGVRPSRAHSLERRDNDGNYEPGNCYWADRIAQANNVCRNRRVFYNGKQYTLAQIIRETGTTFNAARVRWRLERGWPAHDALFSYSKYSNSPQDRSHD